MATGTVKFFNTDKGYGFIKPDDGDHDVFVHVRQLEQSNLPPLLEGMRVGFETEMDPRKGKARATNIRLL